MAPQLKKIILFTFLLVLALTVVNSYVQFLLRKCPQGNIAKVNEVMLHKLNAEVTVWGASTARVHFDTPLMTEKLNMTSFNVGLDGTPFHQYKGLLEEYLDYFISPKLLVIAIDINGFGGRNSLYQGYAWLHYLHSDHVYNSLKSIDKDLVFKSRYIPLYYLTTYDRRFLLRCLKWVYLGPDEEPELDNNGFHPNFVHWQDQAHRSYDKPFSVTIDDSIVNSVRKVVSQAAQRNIKVAVVVPPCYYEATQLIKNRSEFELALKSLEQKNVQVYNYLNSSISRSRKKFSNNTHLEAAGASLFTGVFIEDVKEWIAK